DRMTDSIKSAVSETERRRNMQIEYNRIHGIVPVTIKKPVREKEVDIKDIKHIPKSGIPNLIIELEADMDEAAESLDFERAIVLRDRIRKLREETEKDGAKKKQ
ncbi:MAG: UvrB/UvrC motif-containing protein, partial [Methanomicrobiaceae archaeon]|nr:UvrB/UvrC motif-containing protein [Methanomicrobiaceae archaeon]